jgi:hypothetical protein
MRAYAASLSCVDYVWCIMLGRDFDFWCSIEPVWNLAAQSKQQFSSSSLALLQPNQ